MRVHTTVGELTRSGVDALRGLGFSFAVADRMTHTLVWSEAVHHAGLRFIRLNEKRIQASLGGAYELKDAQFGGRPAQIILTDGKCILESAPRLFDVMDAACGEEAVGLIVAPDVFGPDLLGEAMARSSDRGLSSFAIYQGGAGSGDMAESCGAILALSDGQMKAAVMGAATTAFWTGFFSLMAMIAGQGAAAEMMPLLCERREADLGRLTMLGWRGRSPSSAALAAAFDICADGCGLQTENDWPLRWEKAISDGFDVEFEDWAFFHELIGRTRAPTSERSRAQAG